MLGEGACEGYVIENGIGEKARPGEIGGGTVGERVCGAIMGVCKKVKEGSESEGCGFSCMAQCGGQGTEICDCGRS